MQKEKKKKVIILIQLIVIIQILMLANNPFSEDSIDSNILFNPDIEEFQLNSPSASGEYTWITNGGFDTADDWYSETSGDSSDFDSGISNDLANYKVVGETRTFSFVSYPVNDTVNPIWNVTQNPEIPFNPGDFDGNPGTYEEMFGITNGTGMWAYHSTWSGDRNLASMHFAHDVRMPVNMSGYEITSVQATASFNASCNPSLIEVNGDDPSSFMYYDHVKCYLEVSDLNNNSKNRIAYNRSTTWGLGSENVADGTPYNNISTEEYDEDLQIFALTRALANNGYDFRFVVGVDINSEPSGGNNNDHDVWELIYVNYVNLTFTYTKKIDQFNTVSWNQDGAALPEDIQVDNATLKFKYNISSDWPTDSPNSEFRIYINGNPHSETYKLSELNSTLRDANEDGINVKPLIEYVNLAVNRQVNLSIQVFIADDFLHDHNITISIDDVSLYIGYTMLGTEIETKLNIYLNGNNVTGDPIIEVPLGSILNITVEYTNNSFEYIPGAQVTLNRLGETDVFDQDDTFEQYNLSINVDEQLLRGLNNLDLRVMKPTYKSKGDTIGVFVRKINTTISSLGGDEIVIVPEMNAFLEIQLDNEDSGETIKDAAVSYSSPLLGSGNLEDADNDGIFNGTIENVPEGVHNVEISVYASDKYEFDPFSLDINANASLLIPSQIEIYYNDVNYTADPTIILPTGSLLNITVKYTNQTSDFIPNATIEYSHTGYSTVVLEQDIDFEQYTIILDVDANLTRGLNEIHLRAEKLGYVTKEDILDITIRKRITEISSVTGSDIINIFPEDNVTLQVDITDLDFGGTIKNLSVTYSNPDLGSGILSDLDADGIYEGQFIDIPEGAYPIEIVVLPHENYSFAEFGITINSINSLLTDTSYQIFLNGNETTADPSIELPIGSLLNITVKFLDASEDFISKAAVKMEKLGYIAYLTEETELQQYSIIIETDEILTRGTTILNLYLKKVGYQVQSTATRITIRQIHTDISLTSETEPKRIDIKPGQTANIIIQLENLDYAENIKNVTVVYNCPALGNLGTGTLIDDNNDGIYEIDIEDVPEGVYTIRIDVYADDKYIFDTFKFTLSVQRPANEVLIERIVMIAASFGVFGLMTYVTVYQTKLKYPEEVRKIRKLKKSIKKGKSVKSSIDVAKRHEILADKLKEDLEILGIKKYDVEKSNIALFMTEEDLNIEKAKKLEAKHLKEEEIRKIKVKADQERLKREQMEKVKLEKERLKKEQAERAKLEKEQAAKQKAEKNRFKQEQTEKAKLEKERLKKEQTERAKLEKEQAAKQKAENDRLKQEQAEKVKLEKEQIKKEQAERVKLEKEQAAKQKAEKDRLKQEQAEKAKLEKERLKKEQAEKDSKEEK